MSFSLSRKRKKLTVLGKSLKKDLNECMKSSHFMEQRRFLSFDKSSHSVKLYLEKIMETKKFFNNFNIAVSEEHEHQTCHSVHLKK